jgi:hypothetical protein
MKELGARHIGVKTVVQCAIATQFYNVIAALFEDRTVWIDTQRIEATGGIFCSLLHWLGH